MTSLEVFNGGTAFVADVQNFHYGEDFVEVREILGGELLACADGRFIGPESEDWARAPGLLLRHRVLILLGDTGTGRRTAGLRLLRDQCGSERLRELEPTWSRPQGRLLPPVIEGHGYLLDLSEHRPSEDFGRDLLAWARDRQLALVVLGTPGTWTGSGADRLKDQTVRHLSPDAFELVRRELRADGADERIDVLQNQAFTRIWASRPKASDACRLARIIRDAPVLDAERIIAEYGDWESWLSENFPDDLEIRVLLWATAFCDGGRRSSVLDMAEELLRSLGDARTPADILGGRFASQRLEAAAIERDGDRVYLSPAHHGLAAAVRRHLWDEDRQLDLLTGWAVDQAVRLPVDDAERVVDALLDLALLYRDTNVVKRLRDGLMADRRDLAVRGLSKAALDPRLGSYVRSRLYTWLAVSPSQGLVDLVADICAGQFGEHEPDMALVRLHRAALKTPDPGSTAVSKAFVALAGARRSIIEKIFGWLGTSKSERAGIVAFLSLASSESGLALLCGEHGAELANGVVRQSIIDGFRRSLDLDETRETAREALSAWARLVEAGHLPAEASVDILGAALAPWVTRDVIGGFRPDRPLDRESFRDRVFMRAVRYAEEGTHVPTE